MAYGSVDPGRVGPGMPLDPSNLEDLYKGKNRTNGFLMRNVDGRIPALKQPLGRLKIGSANILNDDGIVPWGNALWRDIASMGSTPGTAHTQKPAKAFLCGVLEFNQGWQAGHPVAPHGLPDYSKGTIITKGLVGYKTAMPAVGGEDDYLAYLKGDATKNVAAARTVYSDWIAMFEAADDGSRLAIFFANDSGFPIVAVVPKVLLATDGDEVTPNTVDPVLAGATFGGFAVVFEKENEAVFFDINL